jgi:hypothetical protein
MLIKGIVVKMLKITSELCSVLLIKLLNPKLSFEGVVWRIGLEMPKHGTYLHIVLNHKPACKNVILKPHYYKRIQSLLRFRQRCGGSRFHSLLAGGGGEGERVKVERWGLTNGGGWWMVVAR